ncbi:hypothetical protein EDB84DRAFT_1392492 [Lactarius hengduanensis]|nr:hypothetical protein EDB84DRAFT_1392492 [Lactarius hengduanensis]
MSSDLAVQHRSTPPSPASSTSNSLDDRINSPTARVYFGPIQSPEKILIAEAAHSWNNPSSLPVCLSPQIPSPRDSHPSEEDESAVRAILEVGTTDVPTLATPTLDEDCLQDDIESEPTSALATKISRAHDNPSPPPQMQPPKQGNDDPPLLTLSENHHISPPAGSSSAAADGLSRRVPVHAPSPTSHKSGGSLDRKQTTSPLTNDSADLIIFDDSNIPNIPLASPVVKPLPDLLAPTPLRCPAPFVGSADATSTTPLFPPRIGSGSPRDEGLGEDHLSPSKVTIRPHASNQPLIESPPQLCRSVHPSSPRPISPSGVDPSTTCLLQVDTCSTTPSAMAKPPPPSSHSRELRSLSPASEGVLYNLLSVTEDVTTTPLHQIPVLVPVSPLIQPPYDWASTPGRQSSPERPSSSVNTSEVQRPAPDRSPWRNHIARAESPNKFALNNTLSDPNRTPTQRIPIAQRPASPKKDSTPHQSSGIFGRPVFTRYTQEERTRSPIRPLPSDAVDRAAVAGMSGSVVPEKLRSGSEEPISPRRPPFPARPFLRSASDSEISSPSKSMRLPSFPIRPVVDARLPDTIPEEPGPCSPTKSAQPSPARKSALRQPSSTVGSRIPRIGAKPYARPIEKEKQQEKGKEPPHKPAFVTRRLTPSNSALPKPVRLVNTESTKGSRGGPEDFASANSTNIGVPSSSQAKALTPQLSPSLKRKRSPEEAPSPTATQPTVARRVTPIPKAKQKSSPVPPGPSSESGGPVKKARIGNVRKAGGDTISQIRATRSPDVQTSMDEITRARSHSASPPSESQAAPPTVSLTPPPSQSDPGHPTPPDVPAGPATPPTITTSPEPNENFSNSAVEDPLSSITYVTRSRRASQPTSDVFGAVRSLKQHRRRTTQGGTFSSMSAVTLKSLTNTNTARNQHNLAAILETEVVRKPGNRPGSPGTKVRTIDEKRKLEQGKERKERAERRARRASEPQEDSSLTSEDEANLPLGPDGRPVRHRRGPGDEEEYESPKRPKTRARIGEAGKLEEEAEAKTVRWDRGLFTTIYFDDLPLQSQTHDRSHTPVAHTRGALAGSAKVEVQAYACNNIRTDANVQALRLDSLGNLVNATSPLKDIVRENVTIKKFVYDDDAEAAEHEVPKPPSKGKGKKLKG